MYCKYTNFHQSYGVLQLSSHPTAPPPPRCTSTSSACYVNLDHRPGCKRRVGRRRRWTRPCAGRWRNWGIWKQPRRSDLGGKMGGIYGGGGWMIFLSNEPIWKIWLLSRYVCSMHICWVLPKTLVHSEFFVWRKPAPNLHAIRLVFQCLRSTQRCKLPLVPCGTSNGWLLTQECNIPTKMRVINLSKWGKDRFPGVAV